MSADDDELPEFWRTVENDTSITTRSKPVRLRDRAARDERPSEREFTPLHLREGAEYLAYGAAADVWKVTEPVSSTAVDSVFEGGAPPDAFCSLHGALNLTLVCKVFRVSSLSHELAVSGNKFHKKLWKAFLEDYHFKIDTWKMLSHENIVRVAMLGDNLNLRVEHCETGCVREYLKRERRPYARKAEIIFDLLKGLKYMHTRNPPVVHGNLNAGKLFIDAAGTTKIGEFGLAAHCYPIAPFVPAVSVSGLSRWFSPEMLGNDSNDDDDDDNTVVLPTTASDIWALGCVLYEVIAERLPYSECKYDIRVQQSILSGEPPGKLDTNFKDNHFIYIWSVIEKCWSMQPAVRPSASVVLEDVLSVITNTAAQESLSPKPLLQGYSSRSVRNTAPIGRTRFTSRLGGYHFLQDPPRHGWIDSVDTWCQRMGPDGIVAYREEMVGSGRNLLWRATPIIMGEMHPQYSGIGRSRLIAREMSAEKIARSGHC